uniref:Uncharacterized protein n=1 Tax=Trichuris muris TaxID=70415 RepID=A0A5S6QGM1_TRIMR
MTDKTPDTLPGDFSTSLGNQSICLKHVVKSAEGYVIRSHPDAPCAAVSRKLHVRREYHEQRQQQPTSGGRGADVRIFVCAISHCTFDAWRLPGVGNFSIPNASRGPKSPALRAKYLCSNFFRFSPFFWLLYHWKALG